MTSPGGRDVVLAPLPARWSSLRGCVVAPTWQAVGIYDGGMGDPQCIALEAVRRGDVASAGGKGANLGELLHAGFDVPAGFVVTTAAHRAALRSAAPGQSEDSVAVPEDVAAGIRLAYAGMGGGRVAVRSSATAEDLPGAAFAGQQDTYLNITGGDAVVQAVRDCWASLFSERATAYRDRLGIDPASVAMAVVVQAMVQPDSAGVMFTADPVTGNRDRMVIDAALGLGEAVVSGEVIPDHFVVDVGKVIVERPAVNGRPAGPVLSDEQVSELVSEGSRIVEHFGRPQDIEWAFCGGRLFILQARPMTALPPAPIELTRFQRAMGSIVLELLPRRPLPMELTASIRPIVGAHLADMVDGVAGLRFDFDSVLPERDAIVQEFVPPQPRPTLRTPIRLARSAMRGMRGAPDAWRTDHRLAAFRAGAEGLDQLDLQRLDWGELVAVLERAATLVDLITQVRVEYLPRAFRSLAAIRVATLLSRTRISIPDVLGSAPTMTRMANEDLAALAESAARIPELRALLLDVGQERAAELAPLLPAASQWWQQFQQFLSDYGHRETSSVLLARDPFWRDSPGTVLGLIQVLLDRPDAGGQTSSASGAAASTGLAGWQRRLAVGAAEAAALREDTHFEITRIGPAVRNSIREMGRRLVEAGELEDAADVWLLTLDEVAGRGSGSRREDLGRVARRRQSAYAELAATPLIATTTMYPGRKGSGSALVVGAAGGGGSATGRVRIVGGAAEFGTLRVGEVLVCAATNPSWTPLFQRAAAVVVDRGGMASHAAIVAREYGIPAVMGAATATARLRDGQWVTVDGDRGEVLAAAEPH